MSEEQVRTCIRCLSCLSCINRVLLSVSNEVPRSLPTAERNSKDLPIAERNSKDILGQYIQEDSHGGISGEVLVAQAVGYSKPVDAIREEEYPHMNEGECGLQDTRYLFRGLTE